MLGVVIGRCLKSADARPGQWRRRISIGLPLRRWRRRRRAGRACLLVPAGFHRRPTLRPPRDRWRRRAASPVGAMRRARTEAAFWLLAILQAHESVALRFGQVRHNSICVASGAGAVTAGLPPVANWSTVAKQRKI